MPTILDQIVEQTAEDLRKRRGKITFRELESLEQFERPRRDFGGSLRVDQGVAIIAEIKKASPSKGIIRPDFDPRKIAGQYRGGGAAALSVLTDKPAFQGSLDYLAVASREVDIPVLRKDFIIEPYQVKEARAYGADAVLLIATITSPQQLDELLHAADEFGLDALVEVYSEQDLQKVTLERVEILGANNRDLKNFNVDLHRGINLLHQAGKEVTTVSESGLSSAKDLALLYREGIHAALIGEYFMRQPDPGEGVRGLLAELKELLQQESEQK